MEYILTLDQGTTSSRAILFDNQGQIAGMAQKEFTQIFPKPGWVEHNAVEIWQSQLSVMQEVVRSANLSLDEIKAIGITNQRETTVLWNRSTGEPIHHAIVWQDRRTAGICDELRSQDLKDPIYQKTGLVLDAYFSGTKVKWLLDEVTEARDLADSGQLCFGTIDSWLIWNLTGGAYHVTDYSNASRTLLFNIKELTWDQEILSWLDIPESMLPKVVDSSGIVANCLSEWLGTEIPIAGIAGDQQAALFGQRCTQSGMVKNTYGTGCFMLMNTGDQLIPSQNGLLTTIAWGIDGKISYALEGAVFVAGAAIQWLRDGLEILENAESSESIATSVENSGGVVMVPAFTGLGAPYWDMYARGTILGLTRGTTRAHIVRAALESIALQSFDLALAMAEDAGSSLSVLRVDGGASRNEFLMQLQADLLETSVQRPKIFESTALGAGMLAGLAVGLWKESDLDRVWALDQTYSPGMDEDRRQELISDWNKGVQRAMNWAE